MAAIRNLRTLEDLCTELERNAGDIARACSTVGCSTGWLKLWMRNDPKVEAAINDALDTGTAVLESALIKRAVDGVDEPIYFKDQLVGYKTRYSDSNLQFALKARKRDMYGDKIETNTTIRVKSMSDEELDSKIAMMAERLGIAMPALPAPSSIEDAVFTELPLTVDDLL